MNTLVAEISNHHLGDMEKAKELIRAAKNAGADMVKGQAIRGLDMVGQGTMSMEFYDLCAFSFSEYKELIHYGLEIDIPVFFTIISSKLWPLQKRQKTKKIHAGSFAMRDLATIKDDPNLILSMTRYRMGIEKFKEATILNASEYLKDHDRNIFEKIIAALDRPVGLSHHGIGIKGLTELIKEFEIPMIEKHFYLGDEIKHDGKIYRDCIHSADPSQFEILAKTYKG